MLTQDQEVFLFDTCQLPVEDDQVLAYLQDLSGKVVEHQSVHGKTDQFLFIHIGVNGGLKDMEVQLERRCFNAQCFVEKNKPIRKPYFRVENEKPMDFSRRTKLPINALYRSLKEKHPYVRLSDDPGRYLCNYI